MSITLTPDQEKLVNERVSSGQYLHPEHLASEAFRLLTVRDQHEQELTELRQDIDAGWEAQRMDGFSTAPKPWPHCSSAPGIGWMPADENFERAHCDLEEVDDYLARRAVKAARDFLIRVVEVFELLAEHSEIGRRRPELKTGLRSFPVGSSVVYYRVAERRVQILRVGHGARDAKALLAFLEE